MSELNKQSTTEKEKQPQRSGSSRQRPSSTNPLGGSPLLSSSSAAPPELPTFPPPSVAASSALPVPHPSATPRADDQQSSLLYNSPPPPDYILRQFEQRHDRQTIYIDARKAGALDALVRLVARNNKTDLVAEMVGDLLAKYAQLLQENAELVEILEGKYRKKHNL